jgi:hypothetical protein
MFLDGAEIIRFDGGKSVACPSFSDQPGEWEFRRLNLPPTLDRLGYFAEKRLRPRAESRG